MKRLVFTLLLLCPSILLTTCSKNKNGKGGDNTDLDYFDCKINGIQWEGTLTGVNLFYYCACDSTLNITAYRESPSAKQQITIITTEAIIGQEGNVIAAQGSGGSVFADFLAAEGCSTYKYYSYPNGKVLLEENNTEKRYLKGKFWIKAWNNTCNVGDSTVMFISDGKFLVHY